MTEWKPISLIPGYEEYVNHEMNTEGVLRRTVASARAKAGHVLTWFIEHGYHTCVVRINHKAKRIYQHRAIACLFIPNPNQYEFIDHVNRIRSDNRIDNLRWCTRSENGRNITVPSTNTTGYKNIVKLYNRRRNYWFWHIVLWVSGTRKTRSFRCEPDDVEPPTKVIAVRNQMLLKYHREFTSY